MARGVIFDLDGTVIDTESICYEVSRRVVSGHGKTLTPEIIRVASGKRPLEAWEDVVRLLDIEASAESLMQASEPLMASQWADARMLPGALRLLRHLAAHDIPVAVATSTPRATFEEKLSKKPELRQLLRHVVCGDEVVNGKPAPDIFIKAARTLGIPPGDCIAIEDAVSGAVSACGAGMRVVLVPSVVDRSGLLEPDPGCVSGVCQLLPSLLAFDPSTLGLPPFDDLIHGVTPMDTPIRIRGTVVKGFGRGSKELGIPTANVDSESLHSSLGEAVTGIYAGWVSLGATDEIYKTALSIGYNPHFGDNGALKTCEPWILHDFDGAVFYDQEIRLVVCGYIRPEAQFVSMQALIDRIRLDGDVTETALDDERMVRFREDPALRPLR